MREIKLALVGNPNCGKTTLFNALTGSRQRVGNWSGVTIERKSGWFTHQQHRLSITDLPGLYTLNSQTGESALDAQIACNYILCDEVDLLVNIVDATNLERHLNLTLQLLEMKRPMIVVLNMWDVAQTLKMNIDIKALSKRLGCPVFTLCASKRQGLDELKDHWIQNVSSPQHRDLTYHSCSLPLQKTYNQLLQHITTPAHALGIDPQWLALRLLEQDAFVLNMIEQNASLNTAWQTFIRTIPSLEDISITLAIARYQAIEQLLEDVIASHTDTKKTTITELIDTVVLNRFLGIPCFLFVLYLMFVLSINIGGALQPLFDQGSAAIFIHGTNYLAHQWDLPAWLTAILAQGIGGGINTLLPFIPQVGLMFLFLALLEDSGYMARAAFVMDRAMQKLGLPGHAFMPLLVGLGCNVPAIMATRSLNRGRERLLTILMAPFVSCGARLAIFAVFAGAFFGASGGSVVFLLYVIGGLVAIATGLIFKNSILQGEAESFIMELPAYHLPQFKSTWRQTTHRMKGFLYKAGKIILPVSILIGGLNSINFHGQLTPAEQSKNSILSQLSQVATPLFQPIGVSADNWPATVGLVTGVLAKEVVVGTLNTLYTADELAQRDNRFDLTAELKQSWIDTRDQLKNAFSASSLLNPIKASEADASMSETAMGSMVHQFGSKMAAFAYLLFVLLYIPCISTIGAIAKEASRGWALVTTLWSFSIAYCSALIFYQAALIGVTPIASSAWILGALVYLGIFFILLKQNAHRLQGSEQIPISFMATPPKKCSASSCCC